MYCFIKLSNSFVHTRNHMKYSKHEFCKFFGTCTYSSDSTSISCGMVTDYDHISISYSIWKYFPFINHEIFAHIRITLLFNILCICCVDIVHVVHLYLVTTITTCIYCGAPNPQVVCVKNDLFVPIILLLVNWSS